MAKKILEKAILGFFIYLFIKNKKKLLGMLKDRTVIFVTHRLDVAK